MRKRTSDFIALASIVGGAGLGLGLTSLLAQNRVPDEDDPSVRVRVIRRSTADPGRRLDPPGDARVVHEAVIVKPGRLSKVELFDSRETMGLDREGLERLKAQVEELRLEIQQRGDLEGLYEALDGLKALGDLEELEGLEALEALESLEVLDLGQSLTIDILRSDNDEQRRRRRRRRPRWVAEVPSPDAPGS